MIEAKGISYRYPGTDAACAVRGVSFHLRPGEKIALMGANGSGKTTFIRCLNGLFIPTEGEVAVDGLPAGDPANLYKIRRLVGMVFQNPDNQIVAATVERELAFGMENIGLAPEVMRERVVEALKHFHLESYRKTAPHLLSGGERQRLALASIWVMSPRYLILDEPTSLLDPQGRMEVLEMIRREADEDNIGVLFVTQFPEEALLFDRLLIMDRGRIVMEGAPREIFSRPELRTFGLSAPVELELEQYWDSLSNGL